MNRVLLPVREVDGVPRVACPRQGCDVLYSECQSCQHGTVVRLKGELLPHLVCESEEERVSAIMARVVTVKRSHTIEELVRVFLDEGLSAAPVVDESGTPIGMVSKSDVRFDDVGWPELRDAALSAWPKGSQRYDELECEGDLYVHELLRSRTVGDVMTRALVWVAPEVSIAAAAEVMAKSGLHHLPVLAGGSRPVGMLSADGLARWVASRK